jgi:hypothetical protein
MRLTGQYASTFACETLRNRFSHHKSSKPPQTVEKPKHVYLCGGSRARRIEACSSSQLSLVIHPVAISLVRSNSTSPPLQAAARSSYQVDIFETFFSNHINFTCTPLLGAAELKSGDLELCDSAPLKALHSHWWWILSWERLVFSRREGGVLNCKTIENAKRDNQFSTLFEWTWPLGWMIYPSCCLNRRAQPCILARCTFVYS